MQLIHPFRSLVSSWALTAPPTRLETPMPTAAKTRTTEDKLGKLAMLIIFGYFGYKQITALISLVANRDLIPLWGLAFFSVIAGATFLGLILYYTITRLRCLSNMLSADFMRRL
jgi:hypothetical protein